MDICAQELTQADIDSLPQTVRDIAHIVGLEAAIACVNAFRGMNLAIPKGEDNNERGRVSFARLEAVIGKAAALALCAEYGGEMISIPRCHRLRVEFRSRAIRRDYDAGADINSLARRHDMTARAVEIILNRAV